MKLRIFRSPTNPRVLGLVLGLALGTQSCSDHRTPSERTNVVLITVDTTRADHLGCYGYEGAETPNIDALAAQGALFEDATTHCPVTLPSHASILTGMLPTLHGARDNGVYSLADGNLTLAEVLQEQGYGTVAVLAAQVLKRQYGLDQGFEIYDDNLDQNKKKSGENELTRRGSEVTQRALAAIDSITDEGRPLFLWAHYFDPHSPFDAPPPVAQRFEQTAVGQYDAEIAFMDQAIGELMAGLRSRGLMDNTIVVLTGDHGEGVDGPHAEFSHGFLLYQDTLHIPLLISQAGVIDQKLRSDILARHIDIFPTVLDLLGLPPHQTQGRSLRAFLNAGEPQSAQSQSAPSQAVYAYAETVHPWGSYGWSPLFMMRNAEWKFILGPDPELYNLTQDPEEQDNLYSKDHPQAITLGGLLARERSRAASIDSGSSSDRLELEQLANLGYASADNVPQAIPEDLSRLKDPKTLVHLQRLIDEARQQFMLGRAPEGVAAWQRVLARDPGNFEAHIRLGDYYQMSRQLDQAIASYRKVVQVDPLNSYVQGQLGEALLKQAEQLRAEDKNSQAGVALANQALASLKIATSRNPAESKNWTNIGILYWHFLGQPSEAEVNLRRGLEADPTSPFANRFLGKFLGSSKRYREALPFLEQALKDASLAPSTRAQLEQAASICRSQIKGN